MVRPLLCLAAAACAPLVLLLPLSAAPPKGKKYALLVGVKDYEHPRLSRLRFTENDVEELAERLKSPGMGYDSVRLLTTSLGAKDEADMPTAANIRKEVEKLLDAATGRDTVLVAFSGHGVQLSVKDPDEKGKDRTYPYFCPSDCDFRGVSYSTGKAKRLIELQALFTELGAGRAREKLVLIDACRNELDADSATRNVDTQGFRVPTGVGVLFSCKADERAWENAKLGKAGHGVFFHYVLEGLSGKAKDEDGEVTWDGLSAYVKRQVIRQVPKIVEDGAKQTPHGVNSLEGETVLARLDAAPAPRESPKEKPARKGKAYALLVGVNEYDSPTFTPLRYAENDMEALREVLLDKACAFDRVSVLSTARGKKDPAEAPTAANIRSAVASLNKAAGKDDLTLVALSGHGATVRVDDPEGKGTPREWSVFCPSDAKLSGVGYATGRGPTLINLGEVCADDRLVLIDACRKGRSEARSVENPAFRVRETTWSNLGMLVSCEARQTSFESPKLAKGRGVFFHAVVEGLKGEASGLDGYVTWNRLTGFVRRDVPRLVREVIGGGAEQTPYVGFRRDDDVVLARPEVGGTGAEERTGPPIVTPESRRPK